jgi:wobble nucleotide-excising tRNase
MSAGQQGLKASRRQRHLESEAQKKGRKHIRKQRAEIHRAIEQSKVMARQKKKGTSRNPATNLRALGYEQVKASGRGLDIREKIVKVGEPS